MSTATLKLTLEVDYDLSGMTEDEAKTELQQLKRNLESMVMREMGNGSITGNSVAEVDEYRHKALEVEVLDTDAVEEYLTRRVEDGDLNPEDLITQAVRYGMQDPADFAAEMNERMGMAQEASALVLEESRPGGRPTP